MQSCLASNDQLYSNMSAAHSRINFAIHLFELNFSICLLPLRVQQKLNFLLIVLKAEWQNLPPQPSD